MSVTPSHHDPLLDLHVQLRLDLFDHRRFDALLEHLDADLDPRLAYASLILLWVEAMQRQQDGDLTDWSALSVARASRWPKETRQQWLDALIGAGFLERVDGRQMLHSWKEFSGGLFDQRKVWAEKKQEQRAQTVSGTSPGRLRDVPETNGENGVTGEDVSGTSSGTSFARKVVNSKDVKEERLTRRSEAARVRAHEADDEEDDFLKTLDDEPDSPEPIPEAAPAHPLAVEPPPGVHQKLTPLDERVRRDRPASGDELAELKGFWGREFAKIGADNAFRHSWGRAQERYPHASAKRLNDWLLADCQREQERTLAAPVKSDWQADMNRDLRRQLERQGMPIPDYLREVS